MELQKIKCVSCGKTLCEAIGEVKKICPKCGATTHLVITSMGTIDLNKHGTIKVTSINVD